MRTADGCSTCIERGFSNCGTPQTRESILGANGDVRVLVDFAHTERNLVAMLQSVRVIVSGWVIAVVGCASGRDPSRPAGLGRSAALAADGVPYLEPERAAAIQDAISIAELGDRVVVAGKGREHTIERKGTNVPWDDVEECRRALKIRGVDRPISWVSE